MEETSFDSDDSDLAETELERTLMNCVCPNCGCSDPNLVHLVEIDDGELFINVCSNCNYSFNVEDSGDCSELRDILEKRGIIRTLLSSCDDCGNQSIDRFIYLGPDDTGQERIQCMDCKKCSEANINISYFDDVHCDKDVSRSSSRNDLERISDNVNLNNDGNSSRSADLEQPSSFGYFSCEICQNEDPDYWTELGNKRVKCLKCQSKFRIPEIFSEISHDSAAIKTSSIITKKRLHKGKILNNTCDSEIAVSPSNSVTKCRIHNKSCSCEDNTGHCTKQNKSSSAFNLCSNSNASVSISPNVSINCENVSVESLKFSELKEKFENIYDDCNLEQNKRHKNSRHSAKLQGLTSAKSQGFNSTLRYCASNPSLVNVPHDVESDTFDFNKIRSVFEAVPTDDNDNDVRLSKRKIKPVFNRPIKNDCEEKLSKDRQLISVPEICSNTKMNNNRNSVSPRKSVSYSRKQSTENGFIKNSISATVTDKEQLISVPEVCSITKMNNNPKSVSTKKSVSSRRKLSTESGLIKNSISATVPDSFAENLTESHQQSSKLSKSRRTVQEPSSHLHGERNTRRKQPIKTTLVSEPESDPSPYSEVNQKPTARIINQRRDNPKKNGKLGQTLITSLDMLTRGDHICWHRDYIVYHHAIVDQVLHNRLLVFENIGHILPQKGKFAKVEKNTYHFNKSGDMLYRVDYDKSLILSIDETLEKAKSRLNEAKYNFFTNNCEHFATWCKTGKSKSGQVDTLVGRLGLMASEMSVKVGEEGVKIGAKLLAQGAPSIDLIKNAGLRNGLRIIEDAAVSSVNGGLIALGIGINLAVDVSSFAYHTYQAYRDYKKGKISRQDFKRKRMKIGGECLGRFIGSSTLGIVGNFIFPVIGGVIGATLGGFIGRLIGAALGKKLSERCYRKI